MLDIKWICGNKEKFLDAMKLRNENVDYDFIVKKYDEYRKNITELNNLQSRKNAVVKETGFLMAKAGDVSSLVKESGELDKKIAYFEDLSDKLKLKLDYIMERIPNICEDIVPEGKTEDDNKEIKKFGILKKYDFTPKQHFEIGENLKMMDFDQTSKISGARFTSLLGDLARLEKALEYFMLDIANENGYLQVSPPLLVKDSAMFGSGQLPKFTEDSFRTNTDHWLIPTSEVSLVNLCADKILSSEELPIRLTAATPCFRSEAGSAGKDTRGMLRQHQFYKVELVSVVTQESSKDEHERMLSVAESVLQKLELPYRIVMKCVGDTGFTATKTYDIEVWLPGQNVYREISSCSNCGDFQARRANIKYKDSVGKKEYAHTLNGSSLAVGRCLIAVIENYQQNDGSVFVPEKLRGFLGGKERINK